VASDLFVARGYAAVAMRDIAVAAQMTKGGVYGHFRSKGQLLMEVIRWRLAVREHSDDFVDSLSDPDRAIGLMYDDRGRETRLLEVDAAAGARHDADVAAGLTDLHRSRQVRIGAAVASAGVSDPETVAWLISALSAGIAMKEASAMPAPDAGRLHTALFTMLQSVVEQPGERRSRRRSPLGRRSSI
jgi:AcrR family transcriptional regulator